jgi:hypothetical protein
MSEKEKPKRGKIFGIERSCLILSLYPLLLCSVCSIGWVYWMFGGYVKSSLDSEYIPTAEYLLENPVEEGDFSLRVVYNNSFGPPDTNICIAVRASSREFLNTITWSDLYINEQIVGHYYDGQNYIEDESGIYRSFCVSGHLESGLHIFEFHAKRDPLAEPYYSHRWAIEIP